MAGSEGAPLRSYLITGSAAGAPDGPAPAHQFCTPSRPLAWDTSLLTRSEIEPAAPSPLPLRFFGFSARTRTLRQLRHVLSAPDGELYDALEDVLGRCPLHQLSEATAVCLFFGLRRAAAWVRAAPRLAARCPDLLTRTRKLAEAVEVAGPVGAMPLHTCDAWLSCCWIFWIGWVMTCHSAVRLPAGRGRRSRSGGAGAFADATARGG